MIACLGVKTWVRFHRPARPRPGGTGLRMRGRRQLHFILRVIRNEREDTHVQTNEHREEEEEEEERLWNNIFHTFPRRKKKKIITKKRFSLKHKPHPHFLLRTDSIPTDSTPPPPFDLPNEPFPRPPPPLKWHRRQKREEVHESHNTEMSPAPRNHKRRGRRSVLWSCEKRVQPQRSSDVSVHHRHLSHSHLTLGTRTRIRTQYLAFALVLTLALTLTLTLRKLWNHPRWGKKVFWLQILMIMGEGGGEEGFKERRRTYISNYHFIGFLAIYLISESSVYSIDL